MQLRSRRAPHSGVEISENKHLFGRRDGAEHASQIGIEAVFDSLFGMKSGSVSRDDINNPSVEDQLNLTRSSLQIHKTNRQRARPFA